MCHIQNLLSIIALGGVQLPLHCTQPVFGIHGVCRVGKHRGMTSHELRMFVSWHLRHLHLWLRLLLLHLLHGYQGLTNRLDCLSLHQKTSARLSLGVVVATAAGMPHPVVPAALAGHAFHLETSIFTTLSCKSHIRTYLANLSA